MLKEEALLRTAANNLILLLLTNTQIKQGLESFETLLSMSDFEKRIFENPSAMSAYSRVKDGLFESFEGFKSTYGSSVISATYEAFKGALSVPEFCMETGIKTDLTKTEAAMLFNKVFKELSDHVESFSEEADGYAIFVEMVRQALNPVKEPNVTVDVCPYCDGVPARISKAEFFGEQIDDVDGYVWACECGAYAHIDADGAVVGTIADTALHRLRRSTKHITFELLRLAGVTVFEGCKWLSGLTGKQILKLQDIEFLNEEDCNGIVAAFECFKTRLKTVVVSYPKSHTELMTFLDEGGRFSALNAYGYKNGRLFVPIKVGNEAVRVRFRKTVQDIMLPKELEYQFNGQQFSLCHPTGKREKFKLFSKEQRLMLYKEDDKDV